MCIIAAKKAGAAMPDAETIRTMWYNNPDGAGYMWADGKKVHIRKGFMALPDLETDLANTAKKVDFTAVPAVLHFRIRTHGKVSPACCHPFPVSGDMADLFHLRTASPLAIAHNGIIPCVTPGPSVSDTMQFVVDFLAPMTKSVPTWYKNPDLCNAVETAAKSRLAVLSSDGSLAILGKEWAENNGIMYSNTSYMPPAWDIYDTLETTRYRNLMWLPSGSYIVDNGGPCEDDIDLMLMDSGGQLYDYDYDYDIAFPIPGTAYTAAGIPVQFTDNGDLECMPVSEGGCIWYS